MRSTQHIFLISLFFFFSFLQLKSQNILVEGTLNDLLNKNPIIGALVEINNERSFTNEKGYFAIESKSQRIKINITAENYEKFEKEINSEENISLKIELNRREIKLSEVVITGNKKNIFKKISLYDDVNMKDTLNIDGFYAVNLYQDEMSSEIWFTENKKCIEIKTSENNPYSGKKCLEVKWDKQGGGCSWIGMGIGWDGWQGKDMATIMEKAAISIFVKTKRDTLKNLPLALALEDYSGIQAYTGFSPNFIAGKKITPEWSQIIIPLNSFPYKEKDLGSNNIKQFIIQFEADGEIFMDEIKLIPFEGNLKPKTQITKRVNDILVDGIVNTKEWDNSYFEIGEAGKFNLLYDDEFLYLSGKITDNSPLTNLKDDADIWNGDAIELAIGTNPDADLNRTKYLLSDIQLGIKMNANPYIWNWRKKSRVNDATVKNNLTEDGYTFEAKIPLSNLGNMRFLEGKNYGFELALDNGDNSGKRIKQFRWASAFTEGFHINPALWGILNVQTSGKNE